MGTVYRKTFTKPVSADAELFTRKGERFARWKDGKNKPRLAPLINRTNAVAYKLPGCRSLQQPRTGLRSQGRPRQGNRRLY